MPRMTRSPATPGPIGPLWSLHLVAAIYARRLSRAIPVGTVAHAGAKMSKKFNTKYTNHGGARTRPTIIDEIHDEWCRANGYKSSSKVTQEARPQAEGSSFKPKSTSSRIREPG